MKKRKYNKSGKYKKVETVSISGGIPEGMKLPKSKTTVTPSNGIAYINKEGRVFKIFTPNKDKK